MELKPGYKKTEVGVIPENWDVKPITRVTSEIFLGLTSKVDYVNHGGIPLIRATDIAGGRLTFDAARSISHKQHSALTKYRCAKRGDVLVSKSGSLGVCAIVDVDTEFSIYESIIVLQPSHCLDSRFLLSLLRHEATQNRMIGDRVGSTVGHLNLEVFRSLLIPLPLLPEQRSIATTLSDMDELLGALDRLIAKKRNLKQAAMQQLLTGKTRLPGFSDGWEVRSLYEIVEHQKALFDDGDWVEAEHITVKGIRLVQTGNVGVGQFIEKDVKKYIYEESFNRLKCKLLQVGDILICRLADPAGRACVLPEIGEERVITSVDVTIFRPRSEVSNRNFLVQYLSTREWFKKVLDHVGGTTHKRISRGSLGKLEVPFPNLEEQTAIATVLSDMDAEIAILEQRRDKIRALKQAMMQALLTGRIRLV